MKLIHVGGARGVGKSTLLSQVPLFALGDYPVKVISVSRLLFDAAQAIFGLSWLELNDERKFQIRDSFIKQSLSLPYEILLLDSHYIDIENGVPKVILPSALENSIDCHIIIEADPREILSRRSNEKRKRSLDLKEIEIEIEAEKEAAVKVSVSTNKPLFIMQNNSLDLSVKVFVLILEQYLYSLKRGNKHGYQIHYIE